MVALDELEWKARSYAVMKKIIYPVLVLFLVGAFFEIMSLTSLLLLCVFVGCLVLVGIRIEVACRAKGQVRQLLFEGDRLAGFLEEAPQSEPSETKGNVHVSGLFVDPAFQGRGCGKALMESLAADERIKSVSFTSSMFLDIYSLLKKKGIRWTRCKDRDRIFLAGADPDTNPKQFLGVV